LHKINDIVPRILDSDNIQNHWSKYQNEYPYAKDIDFNMIASALIKTIEFAGIELPLRSESLQSKLERNQKLAEQHNSKVETSNKSKIEPEI
jgi:hypothetical protein